MQPIKQVKHEPWTATVWMRFLIGMQVVQSFPILICYSISIHQLIYDTILFYQYFTSLFASRNREPHFVAIVPSCLCIIAHTIRFSLLLVAHAIFLICFGIWNGVFYILKIAYFKWNVNFMVQYSGCSHFHIVSILCF